MRVSVASTTLACALVATSARAEVPTAIAAPFSIVVDGKQVVFAHGRATPDFEGLAIEISNAPLTCHESLPRDKSGNVTVERLAFTLPAGPGRTFFTGHSISLFDGRLSSPRRAGEPLELEPYQLSGRFDAFQPSAGARVKAQLALDLFEHGTRVHGAGRIDVVLCADPDGLLAGHGTLPVEVPAHSLRGSYEADKLEYRSAIATVVHHDAANVDVIETISFYPTDVTCANEREHNGDKHFIVIPIGGASSLQRFVGTTQPAGPRFVTPSFTRGKKDRYLMQYSFGRGRYDAWIRLDKLDFRKDAMLSGALVAVSAPYTMKGKLKQNGAFSGTFEARVCPYQR